MVSMKRRVEILETTLSQEPAQRPFLWPPGIGLTDALERAGLSLADKPFFAIRLIGVGMDRQPIECPLYERDKHLLT